MAVWLNKAIEPQGPASCRCIPAYLAIEKSSVIAMSYNAGPYVGGGGTHILPLIFSGGSQISPMKILKPPPP